MCAVGVPRKAVRPSAGWSACARPLKVSSRARVSRLVRVRDDIMRYVIFTNFEIGSCFGSLLDKTVTKTYRMMIKSIS